MSDKRLSAYFRRAGLLSVCAGLGLACSTAHSSATASLATPTQTPSIPVQPQSAPLSEEDKMPRVKGDEAKRLFDKGEAVLVDVRGADQYKLSHAKPAISIPLMEIEAGKFGSLPKDKRIIAYCT
jgi:hypothetical protein